jgi:methyl-accepting chemotaxis protein
MGTSWLRHCETRICTNCRLRCSRARRRSTRTTNLNPMEKVELNDAHFLALVGRLSAPGDPHHLGYVILASYEKPLQVLGDTQRLIWLISSLAILLGAVGIWFLVRKVTEPLQELRDSVEALGQGNLSRRIEVSSMDECGELGQAFNQMAESIKGFTRTIGDDRRDAQNHARRN